MNLQPVKCILLEKLLFNQIKETVGPPKGPQQPLKERVEDSKDEVGPLLQVDQLPQQRQLDLHDEELHVTHGEEKELVLVGVVESREKEGKVEF